MKEKDILLKLLEAGKPDSLRTWITTKELDAILLQEWGNDYDAKMHCNSMLRRGLIDYWCDGDWSIDITKEEIEEEYKEE